MNSLIETTFNRSRTVILTLVFILLSGTAAYLNIPKESDPDIAIPIIYVVIEHEGISPEDAERLLVRPMEKELRSIEGVKEMRSTARQGSASILLEFEAGFDSDKAMQDVREKVDVAKTELPAESNEPSVNEVNFALFPVITIALSGNVPERTLVSIARDLKEKLEGIPTVLEADIGGNREEVVDVIVDPLLMESYSISPEDIYMTVTRNNQLVAAGAMDTGKGRMPVKVPGVFETAEDVLTLPVKVSGDKVVTFQEISMARRTFKEPEGFARVNGTSAVTLEISKRVGSNIIETIDKVRQVVAKEKEAWPAGIEVTYLQDKSEEIKTVLHDLQNNVISAIALVMIVIIGTLGLRSAGLVGISIPGSFLLGILVIAFMGLTINIVVLFSLILAVGMLVDGAIVVTEFADRKMAEGLPRREAYASAAKRMAWPIIASTITTLAVFMPLLFWPGVVGEFMKFLPVTLIATLTASLLMALLFVPNLGAIFGKRGVYGEQELKTLASAETGDIEDIKGFTGFYVKTLHYAIDHPAKIFLSACAVLVLVYASYAKFGHGVEFFPDVEPENVAVHVRARGDMSVFERDALTKMVESRIMHMKELKSVYGRSGLTFRTEVGQDVIGVIQIELVDWEYRRPASEIMEEIRALTEDIPGIILETRKQEQGPPTGKPVQIELSSRFPELLPAAIMKTREGLGEIGGYRDIQDTRPMPGIEWQVKVDRTQASRFGADITTVGKAVQLVTNGIKVGDFRPDSSDEEVDIRVRFPYEHRNMDQLDSLRVPTRYGQVPASNFVVRRPAQKVGTINRTNGERVLSVEADIEEGLLADTKVNEIRDWLEGNLQEKKVSVRFKGEDEEQKKAEDFLVKAFAVAIFLMGVILVTQFNSFYQAFLILSAVIFSTTGVLIGLMLKGEPFGIVMSGVGVIALAGIVVNNNIVLIDTYNYLRQAGMQVREAILRTGAQRLRPVLLTTVTTILGLVPMVMGWNVDLITGKVAVGGPSTQWWIQLSTAIAGGLAFATMLTLVLTPSLLMLGHRISEFTGYGKAVDYLTSEEASGGGAGDKGEKIL